MGILGSVASLLRTEEQGESAVLASETFRRQRVCAMLEGAATGVMGFAVYVLERGAQSPDFLVVIMGMFQIIGQLFSFPFGYYFEGKPKKTLFIISVSLLCVSALGFVVFPPGIAFIIWLGLLSIANSLVIPAKNAIFQSNYSPRERSRFLGNVAMFSAFANIALMLITSWVLDKNYGMYKVLFPAALLLMSASYLKYSKIATRPRESAPHAEFKPWSPFVEIVRLLRRDRRFLQFEVGFFLYGCGVMFLWSIQPIYFNKHFNASFVAFGAFTVINLALTIFAPLVGKWADSRTPPKVAATSFLMLVLLPLMLWAAPNMYFAMFASVWQAFAMMGVNITWNLGPVYFSGRRDASSYVGAHATLAGLRGLVAYPFSALLREATGIFWPHFVISASLLLIAFCVMLSLSKHQMDEMHLSDTASGRFQVTELPVGRRQ